MQNLDIQSDDAILWSVVGYCEAYYSQGSDVQALLLNESPFILPLTVCSLPSEQANETPTFPLYNQTPLI